MRATCSFVAPCNPCRFSRGITCRRPSLNLRMTKSSPGPDLYSTSFMRGSFLKVLARSNARSMPASVVTTLCFAMNPLPQCHQLVEIASRSIQDSFHIGALCIFRSNRIFTIHQSYIAVRSKLHNHLRLAQKPVNVATMVVGVHDKSNAVELARTHSSL